MRQELIARGDPRDFTYRSLLSIDRMITHVMPLAEINNAFELMKRGESIRGVVTFQAGHRIALLSGVASGEHHAVV